MTKSQGSGDAGFRSRRGSPATSPEDRSHPGRLTLNRPRQRDSFLRRLPACVKIASRTEARTLRPRQDEDMLDTILIIIAFLLQIIGLAGCFLPWLAGPPFNFAGLLLLSLIKGWDTFSPLFLMVMAVLTLLTMLLDYVLPLAGAKKYGSTKQGFWGAFFGMVIGIFLFPPWGMIIGAFAGAVIGELLGRKDNAGAVRAGWGVFLGIVTALILKLLVSGIMTFFFVKALF